MLSLMAAAASFHADCLQQNASKLWWQKSDFKFSSALCRLQVAPPGGGCGFEPATYLYRRCRVCCRVPLGKSSVPMCNAMRPTSQFFFHRMPNQAKQRDTTVSTHACLSSASLSQKPQSSIEQQQKHAALKERVQDGLDVLIVRFQRPSSVYSQRSSTCTKVLHETDA
jgi:hypothetical protein